MIERLDAKIKKLEKQREETYAKSQKSCSHPASEVIEGEYKSGHYFTSPPFRVCKLCGYAEEGWHCGYWKLSDGYIPSVSREYAMKYVIGGVRSQEDISKERFNR